jgi:hypothetical protein
VGLLPWDTLPCDTLPWETLPWETLPWDTNLPWAAHCCANSLVDRICPPSSPCVALISQPEPERARTKPGMTSRVGVFVLSRCCLC